MTVRSIHSFPISFIHRLDFSTPYMLGLVVHIGCSYAVQSVLGYSFETGCVTCIATGVAGDVMLAISKQESATLLSKKQTWLEQTKMQPAA